MFNLQETDVRRLSTQEAADVLGLTRQQVANLIKAGVITRYARTLSYNGQRTLSYEIPADEVERVRVLREELGLASSA